MAARKSTRVNRNYKTKYRVTNWREYERGLRGRGDISVWFSDEAREAWTPPNNGRRGGQPRYSNLVPWIFDYYTKLGFSPAHKIHKIHALRRVYSNLAIVTAKTLRMVFHLPLRQSEGFLDSLLRLMELDLKAPDHTTLSRRNKDVDVPCPTRAHDGALHLIVDSKGLKISGAGEWHAHRQELEGASRMAEAACRRG